TPLFQVMFVLDHDAGRRVEPADLSFHAARIDTRTSKFDLSLNLEEMADGFDGWLEYSTELFERATAARLVGHFQTLLTGAAQDPRTPLSALPLLPPDEQHQLHRWNDTRVDYPQEHLLHRLIEQQARGTPDAEAVRFEGDALSYRELDRRATRL